MSTLFVGVCCRGCVDDERCERAVAADSVVDKFGDELATCVVGVVNTDDSPVPPLVVAIARTVVVCAAAVAVVVVVVVVSVVAVCEVVVAVVVVVVTSVVVVVASTVVGNADGGCAFMFVDKNTASIMNRSSA